MTLGRDFQADIKKIALKIARIMPQVARACACCRARLRGAGLIAVLAMRCLPLATVSFRWAYLECLHSRLTSEIENENVVAVPRY